MYFIIKVFSVKIISSMVLLVRVALTLSPFRLPLTLNKLIYLYESKFVSYLCSPFPAIT